MEDGPHGAPTHRLRDPGASRPKQGACGGTPAAAGGPGAQDPRPGRQVGPRTRWPRGGFAGAGGNTLVLQPARFHGGSVRGAKCAGPATAAQGDAHGRAARRAQLGQLR